MHANTGYVRTREDKYRTIVVTVAPAGQDLLIATQVRMTDVLESLTSSLALM